MNNISNLKSVADYGALGDGKTDDSVAIQKALNDCMPGDTLFFEASKEYIVSKTIFVKPGITINGSLATIIPKSGTYINDYVFSINSSDLINWDVQYESKTTYINQLKADNINLIENLKLFFSPSPLHIDFLYSRRFYQTINTGSFYIDYFYLTNIFIVDNMGDSYAIYKTYGDGSVIHTIHTIRYLKNSNLNCLFIAKANGAHITNIINGDINIYNSRRITLENCHIEQGQVKIQNSQVCINNCYFWSNPEIVPIVISDIQANYYMPINLPTVVENCIFKVRYATYDYDKGTREVDITNFLGPLIINNSYRQTELLGDTYSTSCITGIRVKNNTNEFLCKYLNNEIFNQSLIRQNILMNVNSHNIINNLRTVDSKTSWRNGLGTYYYQASVIIDEDRMLGMEGWQDYEQSMEMTDVNKLVRINFNFVAEKSPILRIYRGRESEAYTEYVDIPNLTSKILIDSGTDINGFVWENIEDIKELTTCVKYEITGTQTIKAYCYILSLPTQTQNYKKGDQIVDLNMNNNKYLSIYNGTKFVSSKLE